MKTVSWPFSVLEATQRKRKRQTKFKNYFYNVTNKKMYP